jgi:penicillin-binding protein 1A
MLTMLQKVVTSGTGGRLRWQFGLENIELGGKTGTTNNNRDAWFMCVTPNLVMGSWVGGDEQSVHLNSRGEGSVMALPIVGEFLKMVYEDGTLGVTRQDKFTRPEGWESQDCPWSIAPDSTAVNVIEEDEFFD